MRKAYLSIFLIGLSFGLLGQSIDSIFYNLPNKYEVKNVRNLNLLGKNLESISPLVFECENIKILSFATNSLKAISADVIKLKKLESLDFSFNQLSSLPLELSYLPNLKSINLRGNLFGSIPYELFEIKNLEIIEFGMQKFISDRESFIPSTISELPRLSYINFEFCNLHSLPVQFYQLRELKHLKLSGNHLTHINEGIGDLTMLLELYLAENKNLSSLPKTIKNLKNLQIIDLEGTKISELPDTIFLLPSLRKLNIRNTPLSNRFNTLEERMEFLEKFEKAGNRNVNIVW